MTPATLAVGPTLLKPHGRAPRPPPNMKPAGSPSRTGRFVILHFQEPWGTLAGQKNAAPLRGGVLTRFRARHLLRSVQPQHHRRDASSRSRLAHREIVDVRHVVPHTRQSAMAIGAREAQHRVGPVGRRGPVRTHGHRNDAPALAQAVDLEHRPASVAGAEYDRVRAGLHPRAARVESEGNFRLHGLCRSGCRSREHRSRRECDGECRPFHSCFLPTGRHRCTPPARSPDGRNLLKPRGTARRPPSKTNRPVHQLRTGGFTLMRACCLMFPGPGSQRTLRR